MATEVHAELFVAVGNILGWKFSSRAADLLRVNLVPRALQAGGRQCFHAGAEMSGGGVVLPSRMAEKK